MTVRETIQFSLIESSDAPAEMQQRLEEINALARELTDDDRTLELSGREQLDTLYLLADLLNELGLQADNMRPVSGPITTIQIIGQDKSFVNVTYSTDWLELGFVLRTGAEMGSLRSLQTEIEAAIRSGTKEGERYRQALAEFAAFVYETDGPPVAPVVRLKAPSGGHVEVRTLKNKIGILAAVEAGVALLNPNLRGIATIRDLAGGTITLTVIETSDLAARVLRSYAGLVGADNVHVLDSDPGEEVANRSEIQGAGTIINGFSGDVWDTETAEAILSASGALKPGGAMYVSGTGVTEADDTINSFAGVFAERPGLGDDFSLIHIDREPRLQAVEIVIGRKHENPQL